MKLRTRTRITVFLLASIAIVLWLSGLFWFVRETEGMRPPVNAKPLDAIVALTGGSKRIEEGFALLKKDMGKKLFVSGVYRGVDARELLNVSRGETEEKMDCCVELGSAEDTIGNAEESAAWLQRQGYRTFYLVTANYHMKRALLEFGNVTFSNRMQPFTVIPWPVAPDRVDMQSWWQDGSARTLILREYTKYLLSLVRAALIRIS